MQPASGPEVTLNLAFFYSPLLALGPGRRVGLWLRGCSRHCPGCISPELWDKRPANRLAVGAVAAQILRRAQAEACHGLTISGGEPFEQATALELLVEQLRPDLPDILIYSGWQREDWEREQPWIRKTACLIDGPFERDQPSSAVWKGSANQSMTVYAERFSGLYQNWKKETQRRLQIVPSIGRVLGIPGQTGKMREESA